MKRSHPHPAARAFTLIELLVAVVIFGIVLTAINTVFYSALRLRERVTSLIDNARPLQQAMTIMQRDLKGTLNPGGIMAPSFRIGAVGANTVPGVGIEFFTTTGIIDDDQPWSEVQGVMYQLRPALDRRALGQDLVRYVTRNMLPVNIEDPEEQRLLGNVVSLDFQAYSGLDWKPNWDTTLTDTNLPSAVRIRIQLANVETGGRGQPSVYETVIPLMVEVPTNLTQSATGGTTP